MAQEKKYVLCTGSGIAAAIRTAAIGDKPYLVVPVVAMVDGVIWPINAPKPERVPASSYSAAPQGWNGRPIFCMHPTDASGDQVSGNDPEILRSSIGLVFNSRVENAQLKMEAWIDKAKCQELGGDALETLTRLEALQAGSSTEIVEVSIGAFIQASLQGGVYQGRPYALEWEAVTPDHLAILKPNNPGACDAKMGCGVRVAAGKERGMKWYQKLLRALSAGTDTDAAKRKVILDGLQAKEPKLAGIEAIADEFVVYTVADAEREGVLYQRAYRTNEGKAEFGDASIEVEPTVEYLPIMLTDAAGARHSKKDMSLIQAMHDHAKDLGANCGAPPPAAVTGAEGKPCGCKDKAHKTGEGDTMKREEKIAALKAHKSMTPELLAGFTAAAKKGGGDLLKAVVDQVIANTDLPFTEDDRPWLEEADEQRLLAFASFKVGDDKPKADDAADPNAEPTDSTKKKDGNAAPSGQGKPQDAGYQGMAGTKQLTDAEFLAIAPQSVKNIISRAAQREKAAKAEIVAAILKTSQKAYTEAELNAMEVEQLEKVASLANVSITAATGNIDWSGVGVPRGATEGHEAPAAPQPIDLNARIRAARGHKEAASK